MVIAPVLEERLLGILAYVVLISAISLSLFFIPPVPAIILFVLVLLYGAGEFTSRIVFNRLAESIIIEKRYFLLVRRRRIIPFWQVTGVVVGYRRVSGTSGAHGVWRIYLDVSGDSAKRFEIERTRNEEDMLYMAGEISRYIGKKLIINSTKPVEPGLQSDSDAGRNAG